MTAADPKLESWEKGEQRRTRWIALLVAVLLALLVVVVVLAVILVRRSPVIARIDRSEANTVCVQRMEASFLAAVGELLDANLDGVDDDAREARALARVELTTAALVELATNPDLDPCSIPIPPAPEDP